MQGLPQQVVAGTLAVLLGSMVASSAAAAAQRAVASHTVAGSTRAVSHEVVRVNGVRLMSDRLDAAVAALIPSESFHRNVSAEKLASIRQKAVQKLVDDELAYQDGARLGITVPAADVDARLAQAAKTYGGRRNFEEALGRSGSTVADARRELRRALTIARVHDVAVTAKCTVSEQEALRFFKANPDRFVEPEQLHVFAITVGVDPSSTAAQWAAAKSHAEQALREIRGGASFEEMALKYSTDPSRSKGGDMGFVHRGSLSDSFEQVAKDLPLGWPSGVVETLYGYHIVRVTEVRAPQKRTFGEVRTSLRSDLAAKRCADLNDAWMAGLRARSEVVFVEPMQ